VLRFYRDRGNSVVNVESQKWKSGHRPRSKTQKTTFDHQPVFQRSSISGAMINHRPTRRNAKCHTWHICHKCPIWRRFFSSFEKPGMALWRGTGFIATGATNNNSPDREPGPGAVVLRSKRPAKSESNEKITRVSMTCFAFLNRSYPKCVIVSLVRQPNLTFDPTAFSLATSFRLSHFLRFFGIGL
jgi:hypothetical protein